MEREILRVEGPISQTYRAGIAPVLLTATADCLPMPRLAELPEREPTGREREHLEVCEFCRFIWLALLAEHETEAPRRVSSPPPGKISFRFVDSLRACAQSYSCDDGSERKEVDLVGELADGRAISIFSDASDDTLSVRIYGDPPIGRVALEFAGSRIPLLGTFDSHGFGRIRKAELLERSPQAFGACEMSLIIGEADDE